MAAKQKQFTIRTLLFGNVTAKLMALAMAAVLWFYAYSFSMVRDKTYEVPVVVVPPSGWAVGQVEQTLKVTMDFPRRFEQQMAQANASRKIQVYIECRIDENEADKDEVTLSRILKAPLHLKCPSYGVRNARFNPPSLSIQLVKQDTVELPVILKYTAPPEGCEVDGEPITTPAKVKVRGRKDVLARAMDVGIETEEVDVSKSLPFSVADWAYDGPVTLKHTVTVDGRTYAVVPALDKVQYRIKLARRRVSKDFGKIPINLSTPFDYPYVAEFDGEQKAEASVEVTGPEAIVNKLEVENIVLYVRPGASRKPAEVPYTIPIYVDFVNTIGESALSVTLDPSSVGVRVRERPAEAKPE